MPSMKVIVKSMFGGFLIPSVAVVAMAWTICYYV